MILFAEAGTIAQISIMLLLCTALFGFFIGLVVAYIVNVVLDNNMKAEKFVAYAGYFSILSMILLFILFWKGFDNDIIDDTEISYYGFIALAGMIALVPALVIFDFKQIKWIRSLSIDEAKKYGVSVKDRIPLVVVIIALSAINMALYGLCFEKFIFVLQGIID